MMDKLRALKDVELFNELSEENIRRISDVTVQNDYQTGNTIVRANEPGRAFYAVVEGEVRIFSISKDGREITFSVIYPGDFFGELSLLDEGPRSASAIAFDDTRVLVIYRNDFIQILKDFPDVSLKLMRRLASRLRETDRHLETVAFYNRMGKVAWALLKLAEKGELKDNRIKLPSVTHQEIANLIVSSRESVSRAISYFCEKGWVESTKRKITLLDLDALRKTMR